CVDFGGFSVVQKLGSRVVSPLSGRYATQVNLGVQSFGISPAIFLYSRQMSIVTLKFVVNSNRKTGKVLCLPQSVLALARC
ncbi:hypothetical protein, partial [Vibrio cincinnatiensis]|uniref:hypothetical protein n=1 Tax=Vibrio cincinnatiensis TaxID=675 RepID=UPI001EDDF60B